jgi:flagellar hook assembly protein FlgD
VSGGHVGAFPARCACITTEQPSIKFRLHAARPSPFTDSTILRLDVPAGAGHVTLAVYNVRGQLVRMLVDGALPPGRREFVWNGMDDTGRDVSAGAYFARCESDAGSDTRKLVLMR